MFFRTSFSYLRIEHSTRIDVPLNPAISCPSSEPKQSGPLGQNADAVATGFTGRNAEEFALPHDRRRRASATRFGRCLAFRHRQRTAAPGRRSLGRVRHGADSRCRFAALSTSTPRMRLLALSYGVQVTYRRGRASLDRKCLSGKTDNCRSEAQESGFCWGRELVPTDWHPGSTGMRCLVPSRPFREGKIVG
jgi:hypothetical protein